jgi:hypothetical protein
MFHLLNKLFININPYFLFEVPSRIGSSFRISIVHFFLNGEIDKSVDIFRQSFSTINCNFKDPLLLFEVDVVASCHFDFWFGLWFGEEWGDWQSHSKTVLEDCDCGMGTGELAFASDYSGDIWGLFICELREFDFAFT